MSEQTHPRTTPNADSQAEDRLDALEDRIDEVRREAEDVLGLDDEQRYVDSGTVGREYDDQTITPPG